MISVEVFSEAGIGKSNEDYVLHTEITSDVSLIIVCDGMGGLSYGAEASKLVAHNIANYLRQSPISHNPEQSIIDSLYYANDVLSYESARTKSKMGASVAMTLLVGNCCYYTWIGDVRIYLTNGGKTTLLTKDHIAIEGNHSFLSRCVNGKDFRFYPAVKEFSISSGVEIFIATDGYYLHNETGWPIPSIIKVEDDATIVAIRVN